MTTKVFILSPNCIIVKGHLRSTLVDLQKQTFKLISENQEKLISEPIPERKVLDFKGEEKKFIDSLLDEDILLLVPEPLVSLFPKLNNQFHNPSKINNFLIELNRYTIEFENKIIESLNRMGCMYIEIRASGGMEIGHLESFIKKFSTTTVQAIDIFFEYKDNTTYTKLLELKKQTLEIRWIYMYNTPENVVIEMQKKIQPGSLILSNNIVDKLNCGNISPFYFAINIPTYTESMHYNSCLNCKISIDGQGEIRNCPSMKENFGNIKTTTLEQAVNNKNFEKLGRIKKDEITVCKDCEFRHICTDCRAFVEDPADIYSKPLKCGYDPYTGEWNEWSTNPLKQKAIDHYGL